MKYYCAVPTLLVFALWCGGCAYIVTPSQRAEWVDRLASAEGAISSNRTEVQRVNDMAYNNQLALNNGIHALEGLAGDADAEFNKTEIRKWSTAHETATGNIKDAERDLALLRDDIEGGGW